MECATCGQEVDSNTGIKVTVGWTNEAERLDYEFCGQDCLRDSLDNLPY
jgi:hypothetical protein